MKTRPHIVTQTRLYDTAGLHRNAGLIAARMKDAGDLKTVIGYSRVLIRIMKIILDLTLHNDCFVRRRDVLASPKLRKLVMERIGGAHALLRWRRQNTWNKARLAAIASGEYRPMPEPHISLTAQRPKPALPRDAARRAVSRLMPGPAKTDNGPAKFRLPVLQNLRYIPRPRANPAARRKPQTRYPSVVLWPHELDGQYVPNFQSGCRQPGGGYGRYSETRRAAAPGPKSVFAPP